MFRSNTLLLQLILMLIFLSITQTKRKSKHHYDERRAPAKAHTKTMCMKMDVIKTFRARNKACFLRADTGPCRADVIQWYFDVAQRKCYRFFWGGCQGNGNRFDSKEECMNFCFMKSLSPPTPHIPYFCQLTFEYGSCFGQFYRWGWDKLTGMCRQRMYSGCGGNQNNFETREECMKNCLNAPNNTLNQNRLTTCFPLEFDEKDLKK